jgi:hypothetical protein
MKRKGGASHCSRGMLAEARIVRRGARLLYLECWLTPALTPPSTYRVSRRERHSFPVRIIRDWGEPAASPVTSAVPPQK